MSLIYRKITELRKLDNNPRIITDEQLEKLKESITNNPDYFNARPLILSNRTGELVIIAGNQRYEACIQLGIDQVPTFLIEGLTEEQEKEIIIRDNVSNGQWDFEKLMDWDCGSLLDWGVDIGFSDPTKDFSSKNEEIDIEKFEDEMILKLSLKKDQYDFIMELINNSSEAKEVVLLKLLGYEQVSL